LQALTIPSVHKDDAGNYMVKANNDAGQAKCYATLIVKPATDRLAMKMRLNFTNVKLKLKQNYAILFEAVLSMQVSVSFQFKFLHVGASLLFYEMFV